MAHTGLLTHNPLLPFRLLPTVITLVIAFLAYWIFKIVVQPVLGMRFYQKQGLPLIYFPLLGHLRNRIQNLKEHDDIFYESKFGSKKPETKGSLHKYGFYHLCYPI